MHCSIVEDLSSLLLCVVESNQLALNAKGAIDAASWRRIPPMLHPHLVPPELRYDACDSYLCFTRFEPF